MQSPNRITHLDAVAIVQGNFANTLGTIPMALGYLGFIT